MSRRAKPFRSKYPKDGNARIIATAAQVADDDGTMLLLQAREAFDSVISGCRDDPVVGRVANAVDYAMILCESAKSNSQQMEQVKRAQDHIMMMQGARPFDASAIASGLDLLDAMFEQCTSFEIGKATAEWKRRVRAGAVLEVA